MLEGDFVLLVQKEKHPNLKSHVNILFRYYDAFTPPAKMGGERAGGLVLQQMFFINNTYNRRESLPR